MAVRFDSDCVGCSTCRGSDCPLHGEYPVIECDICESSTEEGFLYKVDGKHLCEDCLKEMFKADFNKELELAGVYI